MRHLLTLDDLSDGEIDWLLARARAHATGGTEIGPQPFQVGLLFLASSLRTRTGFAVAAGRLGGQVVDVTETRWQPGMSTGESFTDTLRTLSGIVDTVVVRCPVPLDPAEVTAWSEAPVVSGGDGRQHPTQALVDLAAIETERGRVGDLEVAVVGDLDMRAARSLLALFARRPPGRLVVAAPHGRDGAIDSLTTAVPVERVGGISDLVAPDIVYMVGLPEGEGSRRLEADARCRYHLDRQALDRFGNEVIVLSPMPVIDEIAPEIRADGRVRMYAQSDRGVFVRMAVLELLLQQWRR